jgi:putative acetyltransferase
MQLEPRPTVGEGLPKTPWIGRRHDKEDLLMIDIRREEPEDRDAVYRLYLAAFNDSSEANIVEQLRDSCADYLAFVAVQDDMVVGHILFTPATVDGCAVAGMGLAPMAVKPSHQRRSIGSQLVRHGLEHLRQAGCSFVIVLGHPEYYPRFGFELASKYCLVSQWEGIPDEAFMVVVFDDAVLPKTGGIARYREEFSAAM